MKFRTLKSLVLLSFCGLWACSGAVGSGEASGEGGAGADGAQGGEGGDTGGTTGSVDQLSKVRGGPALGRRLTHREYLNAIKDVLKVDLTDLAGQLPKDTAPDVESFLNAGLLPTGRHIDAYATLAARVAEQMDWEALEAELGCDDHTKSCHKELVSRMGLRLFRRPLPDDRADDFRNILELAEDEDASFRFGAGLVLQAMLQSPEFLYRLEAQSGSGLNPVDNWELATRLSFLIWGSVPDDELLEAAAKGNLDVAEQVERLLRDDRARRGLHHYVDAWLELDRLNQITRNPNLFPEFSRGLALQMGEETRQFFEALAFNENDDFLTAATAQWTVAPPDVASLYGYPSSLPGPERYDLSDDNKRIGFLTHSSVLTLAAVADEGAIIDRGVFMMRKILCRHIPEPPANAANSVEPATEGSERDRLAVHREAPACAACHDAIDPLGYAFESYTAIGSYREKDKFGFPLSGDGVLDLDGGSQPYGDIEEFVTAVAASDEFKRCMVSKRLEYALGRSLTRADDNLVDEVSAAFEDEGRTYRGLIGAIAGSEALKVVEGLQ